MSVLGDTRSDRFRHHVALWVAAAFLIAGLVWVFGTDSLLYGLLADRAEILRLETAKGWLFVALGALFVYWVTNDAVAKLRHAEATVRAVVNGIADGVLLVGRDKAVVDANPAAVEMLDVRSRETLIGLGPVEFLRRFPLCYPDGRLVRPENLISQRALLGETVAPYKALLIRSDDRRLVMTMNAAPVRAVPGGSVDMAVSVMRDVTELEQLDHLRDRFFADAAHALKTPLATMKVHSHLLRSRATTAAEGAAAAAIERQVDRMDRLVANLIVVSRIRDGSLHLYPTTVDLATLAAEVTQSMGVASPANHLVEDIASHPTVVGDPERLAQMVRNLIDIACRAGKPETDVTVRLQRADGCARLEVRYHALAAAGDPEAVRIDEARPGERIWDHETGLDLGYSVSREIARAHNGHLRSERSGAETAMFSVELPAMEEHRAA